MAQEGAKISNLAFNKGENIGFCPKSTKTTTIYSITTK
jgi:hypothetical protein